MVHDTVAKHISFATSKRWFSRLLRLIKSRKKDAFCYSKAHLICNKQTLVFPAFAAYKKPEKRCHFYI
jgi:hypothetical protein